MEPKTIGKFITTLRRANGMTQKELAEKLNVSDKTVSRWERDDGAPDLATIPVIAEIFGVTCDELLRGERKSPAQRTEETLEEPTAKGEKQRRRILDMTLSGYRNQTYITIGVSLVGLIASMIGNLGFLRAYIGFFAGAIFFVGSIVMLAICTNQAFQAISDDSIPEADLVKARTAICLIAKRAACVTAVLFAATLPLIIFPRDTYVGLVAGSWLIFGLVFGAVCFIVCQIVWHFAQTGLLKKGYLHVEEGKLEQFWKNREIQRSCVITLAILLAITAVGQIVFNEIVTPYRIAEGVVFHDYASFRSYMYEDHPADSSRSEPVVSPDEMILDQRELRVYDGTEEGRLVCAYVVRNYQVKTVRASNTEDGLPITAITHAGYRAAVLKVTLLNFLFLAVYIAEILWVLKAYRKKRMK